ncbi:MAG TPA: hypothetical protein PK876_07175 [Elusimicrobiota bacterium]|nr:hypothetical protein [Elusimicrobiota bacterium]
MDYAQMTDDELKCSLDDCKDENECKNISWELDQRYRKYESERRSILKIYKIVTVALAVLAAALFLAKSFAMLSFAWCLLFGAIGLSLRLAGMLRHRASGCPYTKYYPILVAAGCSFIYAGLQILPGTSGHFYFMSPVLCLIMGYLPPKIESLIK